MAIKSFFKKLVYLYKTSVDTIQQFGLGYFLRFGSGQLRKQKLDIFKPNEDYDEILSKKPIDKKTQYKIWKEQQEKVLSDFSENGASESNLKNSISIVLFTNNNSKTLENSIQSIFEQSYTNFQLLIVTEQTETNEFVKQLISSKSNSEIDVNVKFLNSTERLSVLELLELVSGELIGFIDDTILLKKNCLHEIIQNVSENPQSDLFYSDEEILHNGDETPFFKPDWSPYLSLFKNYMGNFFLIRRSLAPNLDQTQHLDTENLLWFLYHCYENAENIFHIRSILYSSEEDARKNSLRLRKILPSVLKERSLISSVQSNLKDNSDKINFPLNSEPKVSIIIPTKDNSFLLRKCLRSIEYNTNYQNYEIIIVDNDSREIETKQYLKSLPYTVLNYNGNFNFSKMNNFAVSKSSGEYLLFLNDDVEVLEPTWLNEMLGICQQKDVGAVGAKLLTRINKIQHAGMVFLKNGFFFHPFDGESHNSTEQFDLINLVRECSSVTGACFLMERKTFDEVSGFDEQFDVFYGDSDLCFKIRELGLKIIYNPNAILRHDGSTKIRQAVRLFIPVENHHNFINKWKIVKYGDPFYNPNLGWNYSIDIEEVM